jgi:hypothetical protein
MKEAKQKARHRDGKPLPRPEDNGRASALEKLAQALTEPDRFWLNGKLMEYVGEPQFDAEGRPTGRKSRPVLPEKPKPESDDSRPEIVITIEEHEVNDQAVAALGGEGRVYQRAESLVRIVHDASPAAKGIRRPFAPRIDALPAAVLREYLTANARWVIERETKEGTVTVPARPPGWCVSAVHARGGWAGIRHLEAVVDCPVLRPDGTILSEEGYDAATGLRLEPSDLRVVVPDSPTRNDALEALKGLLEVVVDFPFDREVHRAAWVAALLTPLARFAFTGPAPLFLADANTHGAGKGKVLDCASLIVTGKRFTVATYTNDAIPGRAIGAAGRAARPGGATDNRALVGARTPPFPPPDPSARQGT